MSSGDQVPKEAKLVSLLLTSAGVPECEPKVIQQLIEFMFSTFNMFHVIIMNGLFPH